MIYKSSITRGKVKVSNSLFRCSSCDFTSVGRPETMVCAKCGEAMVEVEQSNPDKLKQDQ